MRELTISEVARQVGLQPSAIRYYERIGLLPAPPRMSGQRRYDSMALNRLAVVQRARQLGFSLKEIQQLFFSFPKNAQASERWRKLSQAKLAELDRLMNEVENVRSLLKRMMENCQCNSLDQCGVGILRSGRVNVSVSRRRAPVRLQAIRTP
jgi:MerR family transcriptional regulator, redox-sensitive transcriptional activator SoxR